MLGSTSHQVMHNPTEGERKFLTKPRALLIGGPCFRVLARSSRGFVMAGVKVKMEDKGSQGGTLATAYPIPIHNGQTTRSIRR